MSEPEPTTDPSPGEGATPDFEQAMAEVEAIIERIEGGEIGLERAISDYERGAKLLAQCRKALEAAEQRIEDVTQRLESQPSEEGPPHSKGVSGADAKDHSDEPPKDDGIPF